jgi:outer membrane protein OmpA-like peptidoglycan-associated protein
VRSVNNKREEAMERTTATNWTRLAAVLGAGLLTLSACTHTMAESAYARPSAPFHGGLVLADSDLESAADSRDREASEPHVGAYTAPFNGGIPLPEREAVAGTRDGGSKLHAAYSAPFHGGSIPVQTASVQPTQVTVSFSSDSAALDTRSQRALDEIADSIRQHTIDSATVVEAGADKERPSRELELRRLRAVREYLRRHGVSEHVVQVQTPAPHGT